MCAEDCQGFADCIIRLEKDDTVIRLMNGTADVLLTACDAPRVSQRTVTVNESEWIFDQLGIPIDIRAVFRSALTAEELVLVCGDSNSWFVVHEATPHACAIEVVQKSVPPKRDLTSSILVGAIS